jgi:DNA-binding NarL/FixJ family response regulator
MNQFTDRRCGAGRRVSDLRNSQVLRTLGTDLTRLRHQVDSARAEPGVPATLRRRLELIDEELSRITRLADAVTGARPADTNPVAPRLTEREWQCLAMMVRGLNTKAMAKQLTLSTATVRTHVQSVLAKLGVNSRLEAVALTVRTALLPGVHPS